MNITKSEERPYNMVEKKYKKNSKNDYTDEQIT